MNPFHQHHDPNLEGRDFVVGDIHGCFHMLKEALACVEFDEQKDRLFSVGDLVDRGPRSEEAMSWLDRPFFHAVMGNHEHMLVEYFDGKWDRENYVRNGGEWFVRCSREKQAVIAERMRGLPLAITIDTPSGPVGIVHADCLRNDWHEMVSELPVNPVFREATMWSRSRINFGGDSRVANIRHIFAGHTIQSVPVTVGNVIHVDTGAYTPSGSLTLCDLNGRIAVSVRNRFWGA